jgi:L-ribulose-5-phosphate 3-epimerase
MPTVASRISVVASALSNDPRNATRAARADGFAGILFDAISSALDLTTLTQTGRRDFRQLLSSNNLQLVGLQTQLGPDGLGPRANIERALTQLDRIMQTAADLGAPLLCLDLGPLPPAPPPPQAPAPTPAPELAGLIIIPQVEPKIAPPPPELTDADRAFAQHLDAALRELCSDADRYNCIIAARSDLAGFAELDHALRTASCPWLGVDLDPVAILRDPWPKDEILSRLAPLIRHVRVRDATKGADRRTRPAVVGQGSVNWQELLQDLDDAAYAGWLTVDPLELPDRRAAARIAREHLTATH